MSKKIQDFEIKNNILHFTSASGRSYTMTKTSCSCKGFSFHKTCSHFEEAQQLGLLNLLSKPTFTIKHSMSAIKLRKDAIRKFLQKYNKTFTEIHIDKIEKILNSNTSPEEVLNMVEAL